jgi:hypothetical protein
MEVPMQSSYAAPNQVSPPPILSPSLLAMCLFCLIGLAISAAVIPHLPPEGFGWTVAHLE